MVKAYYRKPKTKSRRDDGSDVRDEVTHPPVKDEELLHLARYLMSIHDSKDLSALNHKEWRKGS